MLFATYYHGLFREDLTLVAAAVPTTHEHDAGEVVFQPRTISRHNAVVRTWPEERRLLFAAGLFLTALVDQVCYTHFRDSYPRFRELTRYPKWRGDCPGGCFHNIHPIAVFRAIGARLGSLNDIRDLPFSALPDDLLSTGKEEVYEFMLRHLPEVAPDEFWRRCEAEIPAEFRMLYLFSRPFPA